MGWDIFLFFLFFLFVIILRTCACMGMPFRLLIGRGERVGLDGEDVGGERFYMGGLGMHATGAGGEKGEWEKKNRIGKISCSYGQTLLRYPKLSLVTR